MAGVTTAEAAGVGLWQTETAYDSRGRVARTTAADGEITSYEYDDLGRKVATIGTTVDLGGQAVRARTETIYDAAGRVRTTRANVRQLAGGTIDSSQAQDTTYDYDQDGNLARTTFADGTTIQATYDDLGRKTGETNQLHLTRNFEYDASGRLAAVVLPAVPDPTNNDLPTRPRYEYGYDAQGNQTLIRDPLGHETRFTFDDRGNQLTRTLPLGFGPDGQQGTADDADLPEGNFTESSQYDVRGRVVRMDSFEGVVTTFAYDPATGRLTGKSLYASAAAYANGTGSPGETWAFADDAFGRVVRTTQTRGSVIRTTTTTYDDQGRLASIATPEGTVNHRYDDLGRLVRTFSGTEADPTDDTRYAYDGLGRLLSVTTDRPQGGPEDGNGYRGKLTICAAKTNAAIDPIRTVVRSRDDSRSARTP